ncbi:MAG: hypothetical protein AAB089_03325 [Nitrospirota bacterium]
MLTFALSVLVNPSATVAVSEAYDVSGAVEDDVMRSARLSDCPAGSIKEGFPTSGNDGLEGFITFAVIPVPDVISNVSPVKDAPP